MHVMMLLWNFEPFLIVQWSWFGHLGDLVFILEPLQGEFHNVLPVVQKVGQIIINHCQIKQGPFKNLKNWNSWGYENLELVILARWHSPQNPSCVVALNIVNLLNSMN